MNQEHLTYALVTPARDEEVGLRRLAESVASQGLIPVQWVIVDHGSTDGTGALAARLAEQYSYVRTIALQGETSPARGGPIVHAFNAGLGALTETPSIVVKLDADVSFAKDHFERLVAEFSRDPTLGIASSTCWEKVEGTWAPRANARSHVRGAVRAYRWACLQDVMPLEPRFGWDTIDELKAQVRGWSTRSVSDIPFFHHRETGERDGGRRAWEAQGRIAWYLGYRFPYMLMRALFRSFDDWHALGMIPAWAGAGLRREPRYPDAEVRRLLRDQQRLSRLTLRAREVLLKPAKKSISTP
jgi:poly-beta-1,6-N-acetyl-D-glucosamine synthase